MSRDTATVPLAAILDLEPVSPTNLITAIPPDWTQGRTTFGGLLAAVAVRALEYQCAAGRPLRSFLMDCMAPAGPGPLEVSLEVLRVGKSLLHARATLAQESQVRAVFMAAFGSRRSSQLNLVGETPPAAPEPERVVRLPYIEGATPAFTQHFDYRWTTPHALFAGASEGRLGGYVRSLDADRFDSALVSALIDSFPAPILAMLKAPAPASTGTWMVNFTHVRSSQSVSDFCRLESDARSAGAGYATIDSKLWDAQGQLLALSRQLVVEFS